MCREFLTFNAHWLNSLFQIKVRFIFVNQKSIKRTFKNGLSTKSPFEFVLLCCEFTIMYVKSCHKYWTYLKRVPTDAPSLAKTSLSVLFPFNVNDLPLVSRFFLNKKTLYYRIDMIHWITSVSSLTIVKLFYRDPDHEEKGVPMILNP